MDKINNPPHYNYSSIETIDIIKNSMDEHMYQGYLIGNVLKYVCRYKYKGEEIQHLPFNIEAENVTPVYKKMKGWKADLTKMTEASQMPDALNDYINFLEDELEVPIKIVSVGPDRTQTIKR